MAVDTVQCVVCLAERNPTEMVRLNPCRHRLDSGCVKRWIFQNNWFETGTASCPLCRKNIRDLTYPNETISLEQIVANAKEVENHPLIVAITHDDVVTVREILSCRVTKSIRGHAVIHALRKQRDFVDEILASGPISMEDRGMALKVAIRTESLPFIKAVVASGPISNEVLAVAKEMTQRLGRKDFEAALRSNSKCPIYAAAAATGIALAAFAFYCMSR
jgi:RING finger family protein